MRRYFLDTQYVLPLLCRRECLVWMQPAPPVADSGPILLQLGNPEEYIFCSILYIEFVHKSQSNVWNGYKANPTRVREGERGKERLKVHFIQKNGRGLNRVPARSCIINYAIDVLTKRC